MSILKCYAEAEIEVVSIHRGYVKVRTRDKGIGCADWSEPRMINLWPGVPLLFQFPLEMSIPDGAEVI